MEPEYTVTMAASSWKLIRKALLICQYVADVMGKEERVKYLRNVLKELNDELNKEEANA